MDGLNADVDAQKSQSVQMFGGSNYRFFGQVSEKPDDVSLRPGFGPARQPTVRVAKVLVVRVFGLWWRGICGSFQKSARSVAIQIGPGPDRALLLCGIQMDSPLSPGRVVDNCHWRVDDASCT